MEDDPRAARPAELEERREEKGRLAGDRFVRIVRAHRREFRRTAAGHYVATSAVLEPETRVGKAIEAVRRILVGPRLPTEAEATERVSKKTGLAVFASDNISSSAYATEEAVRILVLAGAIALTLPITLAILVVLAVVVLSYLQAIRAYPSGGGSYIVASENLGMVPGLVAAAALLTDYVLTVSVSVAAGVAAVGAFSPFVFEHRVITGVLVIVLLTTGNLRGIRESGNIFAAPTYLYLASLGAVLCYGLFLLATGSLPTATPPPEWLREWNQRAEPFGVLLLLRAFSSGAVALTGTEAIANGVPAFKPPEARNASITLVLMGSFFAVLFFATSLLATHMGIVPDPTEEQTVLSQLAGTLVGDGTLFYVVQVSTALILLLAANTSFSGFPRLASILAQHRFLPRQFAYRGERLAFSTGIVALAALSAMLLAAFGGSVTALIPLYTIGVFVAFTLSQAGLVRHWRRRRGRGWRSSMAINAVGAAATGVVAVIVAATKFEHGAWMVIVLMPVLVALLAGVNRHYVAVEDALAIAHPQEALRERVRPLVVVPVGKLDRATVQALAVARQMSGEVTAVHVSDDAASARRLKERWARLVPDVPLVIIESPYRALTEPLLAYIDAVDRGDTRRPVMVVLSEFVPQRWWEWILHNQTALRLKLRLFFRPNTIVLDVPYRIGELEDED